jgi:hypothetical protein
MERGAGLITLSANLKAKMQSRLETEAQSPGTPGHVSSSHVFDGRGKHRPGMDQYGQREKTSTGGGDYISPSRQVKHYFLVMPSSRSLQRENRSFNACTCDKSC